MDDAQQNTKLEEITNLLKQFSETGLKFEQAKEKLLSMGYSEQEISDAADNYEYGTKVVSDIPDKVTQYYNQHPEEAAADGDDLLKAKHREEIIVDRENAVLDATGMLGADNLGARGTDIQIDYDSKFASDVGISIWLFFSVFFLLNIGVFILISWLHWYLWIYPINALVTIILIIILIRRIK